ncbi:hypothetical protein DSO57_1010389 [Entomophthora muscae]|uniref:Uncharacterized protein n=1 Tax=Entomophthora muscae TaxID=34485 RepID=A0ACC2RLA5_9FUNG|nr:hypothetical protein DSO57_1010389 [Entomophthora muscae]
MPWRKHIFLNPVEFYIAKAVTLTPALMVSPAPGLLKALLVDLKARCEACLDVQSFSHGNISPWITELEYYAYGFGFGLTNAESIKDLGHLICSEAKLLHMTNSFLTPLIAGTVKL